VAMQGALMHAAPQGETAVIAGLGWDEVRFLHPVRAGDTLSIHFKCLEVRPSTSKLDRGVVRSCVVLRNQHGEDVLTSVHRLLVKRRSRSP
jgi:acyl dehydratase